MKRGLSWCLLIMTCCVAPLAAQDNSWKAGLGDVVITPEHAVWLAGFAGRKKPAEGTLLDLHAKSLALEDAAGQRCVIVTLDLIGIPRTLREEVCQTIARKCDLPPQAVLFNASHTHSGPVVKDKIEMSVIYALEPEQGRRVEAYYVTLREKLVLSIEKAVADLQPAKLGYSHARCGFSMNRRLPTDKGPQNSPYPDGPVDQSVPVLRVDTPEGKLRAVLFGYACHNTSLVSDNYKYAGDYAGFAQEAIEAANPGAQAMFLMGCGGDQNPYPRGPEEVWSRQHGKSLANSVQAALLPTAKPIKSSLRAVLKDVELEFEPLTKQDITVLEQSQDQYERRKAGFLKAEIGDRDVLRKTYAYPVQVIDLGTEVTLVALAGEVVVDYSLRLKKEFGDRTVWVAGYSNDVFAYIPSVRVLKEGGYEGGGAMRYSNLPGPFAPSVEERIIKQVHDLVLPRQDGSSLSRTVGN